MCNQQGIVAVADVARRELEEIARAEQHIDDADDADADGDEMVPIDPDERDADEHDGDGSGGGAGEAQQATEKDNRRWWLRSTASKQRTSTPSWLSSSHDAI